MNDPYDLPKGYFILLLSLFIFTMWGVNLFSLSEIEITESTSSGPPAGTGSQGGGGGSTTIVFKPRPFLCFYLEELGYQVTFDATLPERPGELVFLVAPSARLSPVRARQLITWVQRGGNLVMILPESHAISAHLGGTVNERQTLGGDRLAMRLPYLEDVNVLTGAGAYIEVRPDMPFLRPFRNVERRPAVLVTFRGNGQIVLLTNADFLTPDGLARADNLVYVTRLVERLAGSHRVHFYDPEPNVRYRARIRSPGQPPAPVSTRKKKIPHLSLWSLIKANPISWALPQLALALILFFYSRGRRFGRPLPLPPEPDLKPTFVEGLGRLLDENGDQAFQVRRIVDDFLIGVGRRFALAPTRDQIPALVGRIKTLRPDLGTRLEAALRDLGRAMDGTVLPEARLVMHINTLDTVRKELKING